MKTRIALPLAALATLLAVAALQTGLLAAPLAIPQAPPEFRLVGALTQGGWARGAAPAKVVRLTLDGAPVRIAPDRGFFIAFDRDARPAAQLAARFSDGRLVTTTLTIAPRAWQIERIPLGPKPGAPPSETFRIRREAELAQIKAARSIDHDVGGWRQQFIWPATGRISGRFGSQRIYNGTPGAYHSGLDIATGRSGDPILAPADGVVILAARSPFTLEGKLLMLDHGMGLNSAFLHCSALAVGPGDTVRQGQVIGTIGMTGRATGPHLHWSVKWRETRLDPLLFVN